MTSQLLHKMRSWLGRSADSGDVSRASLLVVAPRVEFQLCYGALLIGTLAWDNGIWQWSYSDAFRAQDAVSSLIEFPDVDRIYRTHELWPFFATRAPSLKRPDIQPILLAEHIDPNDEVALLRRFGRRTITNPFELVPS